MGKWVTIALLTLSGCGYAIRGDHSTVLEQDGVHTIYVSSVVNNSYRYGVENIMYNAMIRSLASFKGITLVNDPELADALLSTTVTGADSSISASVPANQLNPSGLAPSVFGVLYVASEYTASLSCTFSLIRHNAKTGQKRGVLWTGSLTRTKPYPASNQLGNLGTTSPLINDSEFDRTVGDIAGIMAQDMREAIMSRF